MKGNVFSFFTSILASPPAARTMHGTVDRCILWTGFHLTVESCWTSSLTANLKLNVRSCLCFRFVLLISINYSTPSALCRRERILADYVLNSTISKLLTFSQKWAAFVLGIETMISPYYMTSWPCLSSGYYEGNQIHWGQVLAFSYIKCRFVCPHTCLAVVYSMCLSIIVVLVDVNLLFPVPIASAYWGFHRKH